MRPSHTHTHPSHFMVVRATLVRLCWVRVVVFTAGVILKFGSRRHTAKLRCVTRSDRRYRILLVSETGHVPRQFLAVFTITVSKRWLKSASNMMHSCYKFLMTPIQGFFGFVKTDAAADTREASCAHERKARSRTFPWEGGREGGRRGRWVDSGVWGLGGFSSLRTL